MFLVKLYLRQLILCKLWLVYQCGWEVVQQFSVFPHLYQQLMVLMFTGSLPAGEKQMLR